MELDRDANAWDFRFLAMLGMTGLLGSLVGSCFNGLSMNREGRVFTVTLAPGSETGDHVGGGFETRPYQIIASLPLNSRMSEH